MNLSHVDTVQLMATFQDMFIYLHLFNFCKIGNYQEHDRFDAVVSFVNFWDMTSYLTITILSFVHSDLL